MSVSDHDLRNEVLQKFSTERLIGELRRRGTTVLIADGDAIGRIADTADNLLGAEELPMPESVAKPARKSSLRGLRDELRRIHFEATGENPWANHPD